MILFNTLLLFLLSFLIHVLWWRTKMPVQTTRALLLVFFGVPVIVFSVFFWVFSPAIPLLFPEMFRLVLLYSSLVFVYRILFSNVESQSPTLAIVHTIAAHGKGGCDDASLALHLNTSDEIMKRLMLMEQGGWIVSEGIDWQLTGKGRCIAGLFECASSIFGLNKGG